MFFPVCKSTLNSESNDRNSNRKEILLCKIYHDEMWLKTMNNKKSKRGTSNIRKVQVPHCLIPDVRFPLFATPPFVGIFIKIKSRAGRQHPASWTQHNAHCTRTPCSSIYSTVLWLHRCNSDTRAIASSDQTGRRSKDSTYAAQLVLYMTARHGLHHSTVVITGYLA